MTLLQSKKERDYQDDRKAKDYPKMPCGFQCFLCGRKFATDEESSATRKMIPVLLKKERTLDDIENKVDLQNMIYIQSK
jgi:hypothetical protein